MSEKIVVPEFGICQQFVNQIIRNTSSKFFDFYSLTHHVSDKEFNIFIASGLSMNILRAGDKSPAQRGFFKNSMGDLLPALRFLRGLCNFCNYIFFNHNGM